jgi:hypothetical protein
MTATEMCRREARLHYQLVFLRALFGVEPNPTLVRALKLPEDER